MPSLFEWLDNINTGKNIDLNPDDPYRDYSPFQINNGMSQNLDTILFANEMNKKPWLEKELQHKFYAGAISKKKRFSKWAKVEEEGRKEDIDTLAEYYSINRDRAREYLKLVKPEQVEQMRKFLNKGGTDYKPRGKKS